MVEEKELSFQDLIERDFEMMKDSRRRRVDQQKQIQMMQEYVNEADVNFNDLNVDQKKVLAFMYQQYIGRLQFFQKDLQQKISLLMNRTKNLTGVQMITDKDFEEMVTTNQFVVVDVWSKGCTPCCEFEPLFEQLSYQYPDTVFCSVEWVESFREKYDVDVVPTFLFFNNGRLQYVFKGMPSNDQFERYLIQNKIRKETFEKQCELVERIAEKNDWKVAGDSKNKTELIIGLIENDGYCPCKKERIPENKCPCRPTDKMLGAKEYIEQTGSCYCALFESKN